MSTRDGIPPLSIGGVGLHGVRHITLELNRRISLADEVLFAAEESSEVEDYLNQIGVRFTNLISRYREGAPRQAAYEEIAAVVLRKVRDGHLCVYLTPGNPFVFDNVVTLLRRDSARLGIEVDIFLGIGALDAVPSAMEISLFQAGWVCFDATAFLQNPPEFDLSVPLILFQPHVAMDRAVRIRSLSKRNGVLELIDLLVERYGEEARWCVVGPESPFATGILGSGYLAELSRNVESLSKGSLVIYRD